jgi:hypothetical protein
MLQNCFNLPNQRRREQWEDPEGIVAVGLALKKDAEPENIKPMKI